MLLAKSNSLLLPTNNFCWRHLLSIANVVYTIRHFVQAPSSFHLQCNFVYQELLQFLRSIFHISCILFLYLVFYYCRLLAQWIALLFVLGEWQIRIAAKQSYKSPMFRYKLCTYAIPYTHTRYIIACEWAGVCVFETIMLSHAHTFVGTRLQVFSAESKL